MFTGFNEALGRAEAFIHGASDAEKRALDTPLIFAGKEGGARAVWSPTLSAGSTRLQPNSVSLHRVQLREHIPPGHAGADAQRGWASGS